MAFVGVLELNGLATQKIAIHRYYVRRNGELSIKGRWMEEPAPAATRQESSRALQGPPPSPQGPSTSGVQKGKKSKVASSVASGAIILRPARLNLNSRAEGTREPETNGSKGKRMTRNSLREGQREETVAVTSEMSSGPVDTLVDTTPQTNTGGIETTSSVEQDVSLTTTHFEGDAGGRRLRNHQSKRKMGDNVDVHVKKRPKNIRQRQSKAPADDLAKTNGTEGKATNFNCKLCSQRFPRMVILNEHLLSEHFGGQLQCSICFKNFFHKKNLFAHFKKFHNNN